MSNSDNLRLLCEKLFENKVVYREKFVGLVRLENVVVTEEVFEATAVPILDITPKELVPLVQARGRTMPTTPWTFRSAWDTMNLKDQHSLGCPYGGWTIWLEPDLVRAVEVLANAGLTEMAIRLLYGLTE